MKLTKKTSPDGTITLSWEKVPGVDGYRFYSAGVFRSDTWDPQRTSVKFSAGQEPYVVEAIVATAWTVKDKGQFPEATSPPDPPPPPTAPWFPRTYNKVLPNGQDARFCVSSSDPAFWKTEGGLIWDKGGASYDDGGLCVNGLRSTDTQVPGLKPANEMDGRGSCDPYGSFPPWPDGSYVK